MLPTPLPICPRFLAALVNQDPAFAKYANASSASLTALDHQEAKEGEGAVSEYVTLDLRFDPSQINNCVLEDGDQQARSSGTGYALAREPLTAGKAMWEFTDIQDSANDETTCWGAATLPITGPKYDNSCFYVLRSYNGKLYKVGGSVGCVVRGRGGGVFVVSPRSKLTVDCLCAGLFVQDGESVCGYWVLVVAHRDTGCGAFPQP